VMKLIWSLGHFDCDGHTVDKLVQTTYAIVKTLHNRVLPSR
jgi:hypothetical protein